MRNLPTTDDAQQYDVTDWSNDFFMYDHGSVTQSNGRTSTVLQVEINHKS